MSTRQTRRQAAKASNSPPASDEDRQQVAMNGNGSAHHTPEDSDSGPEENIFLFWPNIIGMCLFQLPFGSNLSSRWTR